MINFACREWVDKKLSTITGDQDAKNTDLLLEFYVGASSRLLGELEASLGKAQGGKNWRLLMTYFNMIKILENAGIGLVYGLRFYGMGELNEEEVMAYVRHHALVSEYYRQSVEIVPADIGQNLKNMFADESYRIVNTR